LLQDKPAYLHYILAGNAQAHLRSIHLGRTMACVRFSARILLSIAVVTLAFTAPAHGQSPVLTQSRAAQPSPQAEPVDINTASLDQLMRVPGLPRTWAARIIRYRPYRGKNELLDRGIVSAEIYARIKDHIVAHRIHN